MAFDIEKMFIDSKKAIEEFAKEHSNETFYAFSIDASLLCLNSVERFEENLAVYQEKYPESYSKSEDIEDLKSNTGDWEYQGFFSLEEGFDDNLYSEHYHLPMEQGIYEGEDFEIMMQSTAYHQAMKALMQKILDSNVFDLLNKTSDFRAFLSEHNY
jgi:hypothetical protein